MFSETLTILTYVKENFDLINKHPTQHTQVSFYRRKSLFEKLRVFSENAFELSEYLYLRSHITNDWIFSEKVGDVSYASGKWPQRN